MRIFKEITECYSVKIHGVENFKNRLGEETLVNIHSMCFSDKLLFLKTRFKVTQKRQLLMKYQNITQLKIHGVETFKH